MGSACADLATQQCRKNCLAILGSQIDVQGMCIEKPGFLACVPALGCGDAITTACPKGTGEKWQFLDTCIPPDFELCDPVPVDGPC